MKIAISLLAILAISNLASAQWTQQNSGTTNSLNGVSFTDENNGTVVGLYGTILRTTDGGTNWTSQTSGTTNHLYGVCFTDANNGTVVGENGRIFRTTDGGNNWINQSIDSLLWLNGVSFIDANTGTIVGTAGTILKTTDGGINWISQSINTQLWFWGVSFTDVNNGTVVGDGGLILRTTDGGINWINQTSGIPNDLTGVSFIDANTGTVVGVSGKILRTTDGGINWVSQNSGTTNALYGVSFADANNGISVGGYLYGDMVLRTTNGGIYWSNQTFGITTAYHEVSFVDSAHAWVVGSGGVILTLSDIIVESPNGGEFWQINSTYEIQWNDNINENIRIELFKGGSFYSTIVNSTQSSGSYFWYISNSVIAGNNYRVKIVSVNNSNVFDFSDENFTINSSPSITVTSPVGGEIWKVENNEIISWNSENVTTVKIEYSLDDGVNWEVLENSWPANPGSYSWTIPNETSAQCRIKISDVSNPSTVFSISDLFTLRGYTLVRYVNGEMDVYSKVEDAWSFDNEEENMWPPGWWNTFDYSDFAQYFLILPSSQRFPDWWLFVDAFTYESCYHSLSIPKLTALYKWWYLSYPVIYINPPSISYWQGSCFGFAISSYLFFNFKDEFLSKFGNIPNYPTLFDYTINDETRKVINELWIYQEGNAHKKHKNNLDNITPKETLDSVKQMLIDDIEDERVLNLIDQATSSKHTVNSYRVYTDETNPIIEYIEVYDNNNRAENTKIKVDKSLNYWSYLTPNALQVWGGAKGLYLMEPVSQYLANPTFNANKSSSASLENKLSINDFLEFYNTPNASIILEDTVGNKIQFADSTIINTFPSGIPIIPSTGSYHPPIGYFVPKQKYAVKITDQTDSLSYFAAVCDSVIYHYQRVNPDLSEVEKFYFGNSFSFVNPDIEGKTFWFSTIISEDTSDKQFIIDECVYGQNDSLEFKTKNLDELIFVNWGSSKDYNLKLRILGPSANNYFEKNYINIPSNTSHQIDPNWINIITDPVLIYVDIGNDGTIEDTLTIFNIITDGDTINEIPNKYALYQNYPNPFNPTTKIKYSIPQTSLVRIKVYDVLGSEITIIVDEEKPIGSYEVEFNASGLPSGVYFYELKAGDFVETKKMVLIK